MTTSAFKIVQIYSDRHGASLASQASQNLRREFDRSECIETTWNTELLRSPKLRMLAAREAAEADLVIVAAEEGTPVTPEVAQWLELWQRRNRRTRSTLIALLRRSSPATVSCVQRALHKFARRARMDFFCHSRLETKSRRRSSTKPFVSS
jgi:hypothetical protein